MNTKSNIGLLITLVCCFGLAASQFYSGCHADIVFAVDVSGSMADLSPSTWRQQKQFIKTIVNNLPTIQPDISLPTPQVSLLQFSRTPHVLRGLDDEISMEAALNSVKVTGGSTDLGAALSHIRSSPQLQLTAPSRKKVVVLFTDGFSTRNWRLTAAKADLLKAEADVFTVSVAENREVDINLDMLEKMATSPKHALLVEKVAGLDEQLALYLMKRICPPACPMKADLVFAIDNSGSIRDTNPVDGSYDNYALQIRFIHSVIERLDVGPDHTRVGALLFSTNANPIFHLNAFRTPDMIKRNVNTSKYIGGTTNTASALEVIRRQMFIESRGNRADVQNVVIVVTDGQSTEPGPTQREAAALKDDGTVVFVVGVTDAIDEVELKGIASDPDSDHYFQSAETRFLPQIMNTLMKHICDLELYEDKIGLYTLDALRLRNSV